jgi:hypothetical protein
LRPFTTHALRRFYAKGFEENEAHRRWSGLWCKQFKLRLHERVAEKHPRGHIKK